MSDTHHDTPSPQPAACATRVLYVEDDPDLRDIVAALLKLEGFDVDVAANGREALERLDIPPAPDIVVTDWWMPTASGADLIRAMSQNPQTRRIPAVVITGAKSTEIPSLEECNIREVLEKPIDADEIISAILRNTDNPISKQ